MLARFLNCLRPVFFVVFSPVVLAAQLVFPPVAPPQATSADRLIEQPHLVARGGDAAPRGHALSLRSLLRAVGESHPLLERGVADVAAGRLFVDSARWARFPSIELGTALSDFGGAQPTLRIRQPVVTFGRLQAGLDLAQANLGASEAGLATARRSLAERAALSHTRWAALAEQVDLARGHLERHGELLALIARRAEGGLSARSDISLASGRVALVRARLSALEGQFAQAQAEIDTLMRDRRFAVAVVDDLPPVPSASAEALAGLFAAVSPSLERLARQTDAAIADAAVAQASRMPIVLARVERAPNLLTAQPETRAILAVDVQSGPGLAALSDYRARLSRIDALRAESRAERESLELLASTLLSQRQALIAQQSHIATQLDAVAQTVSAFLRQFDAGRRSWLDVLNAERERFEAELSRAQLDAAIREVDLRILVASGALDAWMDSP